MRLILLGVLQPVEAAAQLFAFAAPSVSPRLGVLLGRECTPVLRRGGGDLLRVGGRRADPGLHAVQLVLHVRPQVGRVVRQEVPHRGVRRGQVVEELLHGGEVLEVARRLLHQVLVDGAQP